MRKSISLLSGCILLGGIVAMSQSPSEEYNRFRKQILSDFSNFKSRILDHYDDFLNGEWHEFEPILEEESPYLEPKPKSNPYIEEAEIPASLPLEKLPSPSFGETSLPGLNAPVPAGNLAEGSEQLRKIGFHNLKIDISDLNGLSAPVVKGKVGGELAKGSEALTRPDSERIKIKVPDFGGPSIGKNAMSPTTLSLINRDMGGANNYVKALLHLPDPEFAFGDFPGQTAAPRPGESGLVVIDMSDRIAEDYKNRVLAGNEFASEDTFRDPKDEDVFRFDFYGMEAFVPNVNLEIASTVGSYKEAGAHWKKMAGQEAGLETSRQIFGLARQLGLNGYLTFRLAEQFVNQRFKDSDANARMSAVHFLLSNMGYDVRLIQYNGFLTVMMPFDQNMVYGTVSIQQNNGRKYTILFPENYEYKYGEKNEIYGCLLPSDAKGRTSDLRVAGLSLPLKPKSFNIEVGKLKLQGEVNENIKKMFYHYPQMPNGDYASSWIDGTLRESLVAQVREQLAGMGQIESINALMNLCHRGFEYKTDQDWHIFEKPYFVEENFLYEFNDCEDRAIFMSYLVWNALGIPCQLIQYPGHESVTVAVNPDAEGFYYDNDGVKYFSADPTFIGSHIGMIMPKYRNASPMVEKHYK